MDQAAPTIEAAADALLQVIVKGVRERAAATPAKTIQARPFVWRDPATIPTREALDVPALVSDPIGTACRAELRRIGHALHAANPGEDFTALTVEIAEMDPSHAGWRAIVLESAWTGIGGIAS